MKLGILYKNDKVVNHRSLMKVLLNPVFRYFGFCVGTKYENEKLGNICFMKQKRSKSIKWNFNNHNDYDIIVKKRIII